MRCNLFNLITALSLALFVALLGMAIVSWHDGNMLGWRQQRTSAQRTTQTDIHVASRAGCFGMIFNRVIVAQGDEQRLPSSSPDDRRDGLYRVRATPAYLEVVDYYGNRLGWGFAYHFGAPKKPTAGRDARHYWVVMPWWAVITPTLVLPACWVIRRRRRSRRSAKGLCESCGYDLRATPGRCPECGATSDARRGVAAHA